MTVERLRNVNFKEYTFDKHFQQLGNMCQLWGALALAYSTILVQMKFYYSIICGET